MRCLKFALSLLWVLCVPVTHAQPDSAFRCGGEVESRAWALWDESGRALVVKSFIDDRLLALGDTYGLYDFQASTHNLLALAARCRRGDRLREFAKAVAHTYDALEPMTGGLGWRCSGGRSCGEGSTLHDTEVVLTTSQFLALALHTASALAAVGKADEDTDDFIARTAMLGVDHLNRWAADAKQARPEERARATAAQARDGQSRWFFTDVDLWTLAAYAELATIQEAVPSLREHVAAELTPAARQRLVGLLALLRSRLTLSAVESPRLREGRGTAADLDRGFWRAYRDNRYAAYAGREPPVSCAGAKGEPRVNVRPESVPLVDSGGWDFSHARRLVHVIEALDRARAAMSRHYKLPPEAVPARLAPAFATALVVRVWNGDEQRPLFANYWDGSNGWYRAGYVSAGNCFEGYGPHGLSDAFALGGFAQWSGARPEIAPLARRVYALAASTREDDAAFVRTYYSGLGRQVSSSIRTLAQLQFWPSLVEAQ